MSAKRTLATSNKTKVTTPATEARVITTRTGKSVTSIYTDVQATRKLEELVDTKKLVGNFADSLYRAALAGRLSEEQTKWVHVLVMGAETPKQSFPKVTTARLNSIFDAAANHIKFPVISLSTEDKVEVSVSRAGTKSKNPGSFHLTNGRGWKKPYFGCITKDGEFNLRDNVPATVIKLATALAKDPYGTMTANGHLSGRCACCNKQLDDPKSVKLGIGPVCAKKWALVK